MLPFGLIAQKQLNPIEKCVANNLIDVGINYELIVDSLYTDLINSGIVIDGKQLLSNFELLNDKYSFESPRTYENTDYETLGLRSISYCINKFYYSDKLSDQELVEFIQEISLLYESIDISNLSSLKKETARLVQKYAKGKQNTIWNWIVLHYIYILSETVEMKRIGNFSDVLLNVTEESANHLTLLVDSIGGIYFEDLHISESDLCNEISVVIDRGESISFQNSRLTPYKTYLSVYNSLKDCLQEVRKKKSIELYGEIFDNLEEEKQKYIRELVVLKISEQPPD